MTIELLAHVQKFHAKWLEHNFPDTNADQQFKGMIEEIGELAHADLKREQGIRDIDSEDHKRKVEDAVGDIVMYLCGWCTKRGINLKDAINRAWDEISMRDWRKYPKNGRTE